MNWIMQALLSVALALNLSSCSDNGQSKRLNELVNQLKQAEANKTVKTLKTATVPSPAPVTYHAAALRSPFLETETQVKQKGPSSNPLQAYPLTTLRFTGTVTQADNTSIAFVLTPDNMIYQVKEGDTIGDHNEKVIRIQSDRLTLMEQDSENTVEAARIITLKLKDIQ